MTNQLCKGEEAVIQRAVDEAVKKTFAIIGVDVSKPESVEEFREDLRFGKTMRRYANHGTLAFIVAAACGLAGALWYGLAHALQTK